MPILDLGEMIADLQLPKLSLEFYHVGRKGTE